MTIEELKMAVEDVDTNDLVAHAEQARDVMLMIVAKVGDVEKRLDRVEKRAGKESEAQ